MLALDVDGVPSELRDYDQWIVWREEHVPGRPKPVKPPLSPRTLHKADAHDPSNWLPFDDAVELYKSRDDVDGVGIVLTESDDLAVVDLDDIHPDTDWRTYGVLSYAERSPSGNGIHIICRTEDPGINCKVGDNEIYTSRRYITITGQKLDNAQPHLSTQTAQLWNLFTRLKGRLYPEHKFRELYADKRFRELWEGSAKFSAVDGSKQSEADLAMSHVLVRAGWSIDESVPFLREFRYKGLYDSGQDKSRYHDYFKRTFEKALSYVIASQEKDNYENEELYNLADPTWLIQDMFSTDSVNLVWGRYGVAKTYICIDLSLSLVCEKSWLGAEVIGGDVYYILGEGVATAKGRYRSWFAKNRVPRIHNFILRSRAVQLGMKGEVQSLCRFLQHKYPNIKAIVFDTLSRCLVGVDENSQEQITPIIDNLTWLAHELGVCIILVHHSSKIGAGEAEVKGEQERGSSVIAGAVDMSMHITPVSVRLTEGGEPEQFKGLYKVQCAKSRLAQPFDPRVVFLEDMGESAVIGLSDYFTSQVLRRQPSSRYGLSTAQICRVMDLYNLAQTGATLDFAEMADELSVSQSEIEAFLKLSGIMR